MDIYKRETGGSESERRYDDKNRDRGDMAMRQETQAASGGWKGQGTGSDKRTTALPTP